MDKWGGIAKRAGKGDAIAQNELFSYFWPSALKICARWDYRNAEDLAQDSMMQLFRKLHQFKGKSTFSTWFYRVVTNVCHMAFRRKKYELIHISDELSDHLAGDTRMEDRVLAKVEADRILPQLTPGYHVVAISRVYLGMEHNEIGKKYGFSTGNSKSQWFKARERLRAIYLKEDEKCEPVLM